MKDLTPLPNLTHCPKCNFDLRGEDIYQFFLKLYSKSGIPRPRTVENVLQSIKDYPSLYENAPSEDELRSMSPTELNAWAVANNYGWSKKNPRMFQKQIGIEIRGYYDGIVVYQCPECKHKWKRFDWVDDKYLN